MSFIVILLSIILNSSIALANDDFSYYMDNWTQKKQLASEFLLKAEESFKYGDELSGCNYQQKASSLGIDATESLIEAMRINNSTDGIENLNHGLMMWKQLGEVC